MDNRFPEKLDNVQVHDVAIEYAKELIEQGKVNCKDPWSTQEPTPSSEYYFLKDHSTEEFGQWFLAIDLDEDEKSKERFKFPIGDFHDIYREGVITVKSYASKHKHKPLEAAADELLVLIEEQCRYKD